MPSNDVVVLRIPNAQHWSFQVKLSIDDFRYQEHGMLDRTHLRWLTRQTIIEMFRDARFVIEVGFPRIFNESNIDYFLPFIDGMASRAGVYPKIAAQDSLAQQYVMSTVPLLK